MQNHYEFNIALDGKHLFATAERSVVTYAHAVTLHKILKRKFPMTEGYEVTCTHWEASGTRVDFK